MAYFKVTLALCLLLVHFATALPVEEPKALVDTPKTALEGDVANLKIEETKTVITQLENGTNSTSVQTHVHIDTDPKNDSDSNPANTRMSPPAGAPAAVPMPEESRQRFRCYQCSTLLGDFLEDCKKPKDSMLRDCGAVQRCHSVLGSLIYDSGKAEEVMVMGCDASSALDFADKAIQIPDTDYKTENDCKSIVVSESISKKVAESQELQQVKYNFKGDVCNCNTSKCNENHSKMHKGKGEKETVIVHTPKPSSAMSVLPSAAILFISLVVLV